MNRTLQSLLRGIVQSLNALSTTGLELQNGHGINDPYFDVFSWPFIFFYQVAKTQVA